MRSGDFAETYASLADEELLHVAADKSELVPAAQIALSAELEKRRITEAAVEKERTMVAEYSAALEVQRSQPRLLYPHSGLGKLLYGKTNRRRDSNTGFEEYDATLWFVLLWFPLIPLGTFHVRRRLVPRWRAWLENQEAVSKAPFDGAQAFLTFTTALFIAACVWVALRWWLRWSVSHL